MLHVQQILLLFFLNLYQSYSCHQSWYNVYGKSLLITLHRLPRRMQPRRIQYKYCKPKGDVGFVFQISIFGYIYRWMLGSDVIVVLHPVIWSWY